MLEKYCVLAGVKDGMHVVDLGKNKLSKFVWPTSIPVSLFDFNYLLGCGWGSLSLYLASKYPNLKITGISNSNSQREYILATAAKRGYNVNNIKIITCNVADDKGALDVVKNNDLVMTVEM
jgi:trans-aconitate methyltransferase